MGQLEIVNIIKTEKGYVEQSEVDKKDLEKMAEKMSDRFMNHFGYEREKTD